MMEGINRRHAESVNAEGDSYIAGYQEVMAKLEKDLDKIRPPGLTDSEQYQALVAEHDAIYAEQSRKLEEYALGRIEVQQKWQPAMEEEDERHQRAMMLSPAGRNKKERLQNLRTEIQECCDSLVVAVEELQQVLKAESQKNVDINQKADDYINGQGYEKEVDGLKNARVVLERESKDRVRDAQIKKEKDINAFGRYNVEREAKYKADAIAEEARLPLLISEFHTLRNELQQCVGGMSDKLEAEWYAMQERGEEKMATVAREHYARIARMEKEMEELQRESGGSEERNRARMREEAAAWEVKLEQAESKNNAAIAKIKTDWEALHGFLGEKIEVLTKERDQFVSMFENREGRPCDLERITILKGAFMEVQTSLTGKLKDLNQFRTVMVVQEKTYNNMFGHAPSIGVLHCTSPGIKSPRVKSHGSS
jgi:hypothetical protein